MSKIVIIGAGFSGISVFSRLAESGLRLDITIIDKRKTVDFLPTLPDTIGRGIAPEYLSYRIADLAGKLKAVFFNEEVTAVDLEKKEVFTATKKLNYDYLVIASGSETNFYGNENIKRGACTLDSVADAQRIIRVLKENTYKNYIIAGGGYTGVEVVTNLRVCLNKFKRTGRIIIAERAPAILGPLPQWMKDYASDNLKRLRVEVLLNCAIEKIEERKVFLTGARVFENSLVIWAAGVKAADFIQGLKIEKNPQGRIKVDEYLRLKESCFVIGDAAYFSRGNNSLRMAVQFSITEGFCAADSITRSIGGAKLRKYRPRDLGYIIPMANNRSCGRVMGLNLKGFLPTLLHFMMCIYRSYGLRNKFGIIKGLLK